MLKSRDQPGNPWPPKGFIFYQPQTGWWSSPGFTFWQTVDEIVKHRKANPRFGSQWTTDRNAVADELDFFTCLRIANNPMYCTEDTPIVKKNSLRGWNFLHQRLKEKAAAAADRAENAAAGIGVVLDWLGDSLEPVSQELAEKRAAVCVTCPQNGRPDFIQKLLAMAASGVRGLINLKNDLNLHTSRDADLHHCDACDCVLSLKVHAKMNHILKHTPQRVMDDLDSRCWILNKDQ